MPRENNPYYTLAAHWQKINQKFPNMSQFAASFRAVYNQKKGTFTAKFLAIALANQHEIGGYGVRDTGLSRIPNPISCISTKAVVGGLR